MEPILSPELLRRLREGVGPDTVEHLDLSNALIVPQEVTLLAESIKEYFHNTHSVSPLQTIDLSGNLICGIDEHGDGEYDHSGLTKLVEVLLLHPEKQPLRKIVFYHNNIGRDGCRALSGLMNANSPGFLHDLELRSCCIDDACLKLLTAGLDNNKTVQCLDLRSNEITGAGMEHFGEMMFKNKSLRRLDLSHNHFGSPGIWHLGDKITSNVTLQILTLIDCRLGDEGAKAIGNLLRFNTGLSHLDIQENNISDRGVDEICRGLGKNRALHFLGMQYNDISNAGAMSFGKSLKGNSALKTLYLYGNRVTEKGLGDAVAAMQWTHDKQVTFDLPYIPPKN